jgi:hypothetical protein
MVLNKTGRRHRYILHATLSSTDKKTGNIDEQEVCITIEDCFRHRHPLIIQVMTGQVMTEKTQ